MSDDLRIVAPWTAHSGYSKLARATLRTALLAGYRVQAVESDYRTSLTVYDNRRVTVRKFSRWNKKYPIAECQKAEVDAAFKARISPNAPTLLIQFPEQLGGWHEYSSGPRIGYTMIESDRVPEPWRKGLYGVDSLLVPSQYVLNTFRRDVPEQPCSLFPCPVDERLFSAYETSHIDGRFQQFLFFSVFNTRERKHWRMMMQAFGEEFAPDESVGLIIRPTPGHDVQEMADWINVPSKPRRITVLREWQSDDQLNAWYRRCDCYVLPSCEGFGLPYAEAGMCGKPSIALDDGGAVDVVNGSTGWLIPSERRQVIGNLPHVYDSTYRFACPVSIEAVREVMRRAYEREGRERKGESAFHYCQQFTPEKLAPVLRAAVEAAAEPFKERTQVWGIHYPEPWALMIGDGFGDAMACVGNAQQYKNPVGVIHYGRSRAVEEFLLQQPCVREVRRIAEEDDEIRSETANEMGAHYAYPPALWLPKLLEGTGIDPDTVAMTQVHWPWGTWPVNKPTDLRLSPESEQWADEKRAELGEFILVQPFSTNSVKMDAHWPYWIKLIIWLLEATANTHRLVFCGVDKIPGLKADNVVDLMGETPTMQHVLALADRSKGVITTCNALGNWAACRGLRALIAANEAIPLKTSYWYRFQQTPKTRVMPLETSLPKMIVAAEKFLKGLSK